MNRSFAVAALLALLPAAASAQASASQLARIGAAGAVRGSVQAVAPNTSVGRVVESGKPLFLNDHVTTDAAGHLQVLLLDETVFTLGPDADMVLDEFVYDPKTSAGKVTAQVVKGAFRFVTGRVARAKPESMKVKLAVGTVGIRGTIVTGETSKDGSLVINTGAGFNNNADERPSAVIVSNAGTNRLIDLTGQGVKILPNQAPTFPKDMPEEIARLADILRIPAKNGSGKEPDDKASASDASGQLTAAIKELAADSQNEQAQFEGANAQTSQAAQYGFQDRPSTWDEVRSIVGGTGNYAGSGSYLCTGGSCAGQSGPMDFTAQINFGTRQISNGQILMSGPISDSTNFSLPYGNLSGTATGNINGLNFSGTTFTLSNRGGTIAEDMTINLKYNNSSTNQTATGTMTGSR